jgi:hypothetical protein
LIASINEANGLPGEHTIILEPGAYTLQSESSPFSGLPVITSSIRIQPSEDNSAALIARDPSASSFRIFTVGITGRLNLIGLTVQRGRGLFSGAAIRNDGYTTVENSSVIEAFGDAGTVHNTGTLEVLKSLIADNDGGHDAGGIVNRGGNVLVENSTIADNFGIGSGGIASFGGNLVVLNSAIVSNRGDCCNVGGGIANVGGLAQITNSTIAKNLAGDGGGVWNGLGGLTTITSTTIRENGVRGAGFRITGGVANAGGTLRLQNTIVAGNIGDMRLPPELFPSVPDCSANIESLGNNFIGDLSGCGINLQNTDLTGDPALGALVGEEEEALPGNAYYPVLSGSPVINAGAPSACPVKDQLGNPRVGRCDVGAVEFQERMLVSVDVRPRSDANRINPSSNRNINVAILSTKSFDSTTVDPNTIRFGANGTEATPIHIVRRDVNGDGRIDQILRFVIQDTGIECGDTSATLTGDITFGRSIIGSTSITTTQCK